MILFNSIRFKNFLSFGDDFTEIKLNEYRTTIIGGSNGHGKSSVIDAIVFALFGKAFRNINKDQLINSINGRDLLVEIDFKIGQNRFMVRRGLKPNIFEIYQNDHLINQSSKSKDYQNLLEQSILKFNYKSFNQIVILGSAAFVPFMALPASSRREVIEDLLDIQVFSKMNQILKQEYSNIKERINEIKTSISVLDNGIDLLTESISRMEAMNKKTEEDQQKTVDVLKERLVVMEYEYDKMKIEMESYASLITPDINKKHELMTQLAKLKQYIAKFEVKQKDAEKNIGFFTKNDHCPVCTQNITEEFRNNKIMDLRKTSFELESGIDMGKSKISAIDDELNKIAEMEGNFRIMKGNLERRNAAKRNIQDQIDTLEKMLVIDESDVNDNILKTKEQLKDKESELLKARERLSELQQEKSYYDVSIDLLKDNGIKASIIKEYVPLINNFINKYLQVFDFFVSFNFDENFNEEIRSRHRDGFKYESFSEGEKMKINLALLFAWRQIAKMKNSLSTNILILDETFDSSLDSNGVENLIKIFDGVESGANIFVISHRGEQFDQYFNQKISFVKEKHFSKKII
jgi:DNA repair exonuclease SbcCD ATPase subunit